MRHPKPTPEMNAGRAIRRAARIIEERGWLQGKEGHRSNGFCAIGAIKEAIPVQFRDLRRDAISLFSSWLEEITEVPSSMMVDLGGPSPSAPRMQVYTCIPLWNDAKGRTQDDVLLHMNKFADEMDPQ